MAHSWTASNSPSSSRKKMAGSFQEEALQEALFSLRKSLAGYVSAMTRACQQIDPLLVDYGNLASVKSLQVSFWIRHGTITEKASHVIGVLWTKTAWRFTK